MPRAPGDPIRFCLPGLSVERRRGRNSSAREASTKTHSARQRRGQLQDACLACACLVRAYCSAQIASIYLIWRLVETQFKHGKPCRPSPGKVWHVWDVKCQCQCRLWSLAWAPLDPVVAVCLDLLHTAIPVFQSHSPLGLSGPHLSLLSLSVSLWPGSTLGPHSSTSTSTTILLFANNSTALSRSPPLQATGDVRAWPTTSPDIGQAYRKRPRLKFIRAARGHSKSWTVSPPALSSCSRRPLHLECTVCLEVRTGGGGKRIQGARLTDTSGGCLWRRLRRSNPLPPPSRSRHGTSILEVDWTSRRHGPWIPTKSTN